MTTPAKSNTQAVVYYGTQDEDLQGIIKDFTADYGFKMFSVQTNKTNDPYVDGLNAQRHMCHSFLKCCQGRAHTVAQHVLQHMTEQENDRRDAHLRRALQPAPPSDFFDRFVRQMKTSLGPQDALVHWVLAAEEVMLKELSGQGLDEFIGNLTLYLQRVVRAQADCAEHLRTAAATGSTMGSTQSRVASPFEVHAVEQVSRPGVGLAGLLESSAKLRKQREQPSRRDPLVRTLDPELEGASPSSPNLHSQPRIDASAAAALAQRSALLVEAANDELERRDEALAESERRLRKTSSELLQLKRAIQEPQEEALETRDALIRQLSEQVRRLSHPQLSPSPVASSASSISGKEIQPEEVKYGSPATAMVGADAPEASGRDFESVEDNDDDPARLYALSMEASPMPEHAAASPSAAVTSGGEPPHVSNGSSRRGVVIAGSELLARAMSQRYPDFDSDWDVHPSAGHLWNTTAPSETRAEDAASLRASLCPLSASSQSLTPRARRDAEYKESAAKGA